MKKKKINTIVNNAFNEETPNFLSRIKTRCIGTRQIEPIGEPEKKKPTKLIFKRLAFSMLAVGLFVGGVFVGNYEKPEQVAAKEASIYLDVNPSIEIQVDEDNYVIECVAGNKDGEKILHNMELNGVEIDTALYAIVGSMYTNGYLNSKTNSILVSVDNYNNEDSILLDDISKQIDNVFKENEDMECSIIAQKIESDDDLKDRAEQYGISIGKMHLIEKIISKSDVYTEDNIEELAQMTIHELDLIYQSIIDEKRDDEVISGKPGGFIEKDNAIGYVLEYLGISEEELEWYDVVALYHHNESKERKMIYLVTVMLKNQEEIQKFIVDCSSGEIMPEETIDEWKDKLPDEGHFGGPKEDHGEGPKDDFEKPGDDFEEPGHGEGNPHPKIA